MATTRPRLVFLVTEDWYFWSHRADLARAARADGFEVTVATSVGTYGEAIRGAGLNLVPLRMFRRRGLGLRDFAALVELVRVYRRLRPDIIHHVALKPVVYGSLAARITSVPAIVNAIAGLGSTFIGSARGSRILQVPLRYALRWALAAPFSTAVFQNDDDRDHFVKVGILGTSRSVVIRGVGVDTSAFRASPESAGIPLVMLPARMLWDKGVGDFVDAARIVAGKGVSARFVLVGMTDAGNASAIPDSLIRTWQDEGVVEWWGHRNDMPAVLAAANVVVLPSYREGLPKVLLEAAASGRATVATDVPGCREIVRHGVNGLLVPARDPRRLAEAIARLVDDTALRQEAGQRGREIVEREFSVARIAQETIAVYRQLLAASVGWTVPQRVPEAGA